MESKNEATVKTVFFNNPFSVLFILLLFASTACSPFQRGHDPFVLNLYPRGVPDDAIAHPQAEEVTNRDTDQDEFGLNRSISFVSNPNMTVYLPPRTEAPTAAVLVFPGGGYSRIVVDKEGHSVARFLISHGIAAIVVKYRTRPKGVEIKGENANHEVLDAMLSDAQRAIRMVRHYARNWNVDPGRIGVMGFSAGGHLCARAAVSGEPAHPKASDPIDRASSRPDFAAPIYPAYISGFQVPDGADVPPVFIAFASNDGIIPPEDAFAFYSRLRELEVPAEMHLFTKGGHGFGLGVNGGAAASWPDIFINWMFDMGLL